MSKHVLYVILVIIIYFFMCIGIVLYTALLCWWGYCSFVFIIGIDFMILLYAIMCILSNGGSMVGSVVCLAVCHEFKFWYFTGRRVYDIAFPHFMRTVVMFFLRQINITPQKILKPILLQFPNLSLVLNFFLKHLPDKIIIIILPQLSIILDKQRQSPYFGQLIRIYIIKIRIFYTDKFSF